MYLVFFGLLVPLIGLATFGYRVAMIYFAVRDTCYKAAKSSTFTNAGLNAASVWTSDTSAWFGISAGSTEQIFIVTQPIAGGAETVQAVKLAAPPNTQVNMYFIRLIANCQIAPFFPLNGWTYQGLNIPGLTTSFPVTMKYQYYVENTSGLTQ